MARRQVYEGIKLKVGTGHQQDSAYVPEITDWMNLEFVSTT